MQGTLRILRRPRRELPAVRVQYIRGDTDGCVSVLDIAHDDAACADGATRTDGDSGDRAGADADECPCANRDASADCSSGRDVAVLADDAIVLDDCAGVDDRMRADGCPPLNNGAGANKNTPCQPRIG